MIDNCEIVAGQKSTKFRFVAFRIKIRIKKKNPKLNNPQRKLSFDETGNA